ncbi:hypothetical protein OIV83_000154 [Microbotryomycetes sp. JL201]|nr:hypothetical protein OIV83_000154 [Microbotryomycetes sp. JL201]
MVAHLSSKLSHLAQSFRPQHHLNSIRNAFPSASSGHAGPGFFDPTNVFTHANSAVGSAAGQAAGAGAGSTAGGAGGAKYHAGSRAHSWTFQAQQRFVSQASADQAGRSTDDDKDDSSSNRRPRLLDHQRHVSAQFTQRMRKQSVSAGDKPLLTREEAGLETQGALSSLEMQSKYREAFLHHGQQQLSAAENDADNDIVELVQSSRASSPRPRRASIASSRPSAGVILSPEASRSASFVGAYPTVRAVHTAAAFASPPPKADVARVRRNSTSAAVQSTEAGEPEILETKRPRPVPGKRPEERPSIKERPRFPTPEAQYRYEAILSAKQARNYNAVHAAVLRYRAVPETYSTLAHNLAMDALFETRQPSTSIRTIVELYSELFNHENLRPNRTSYEIFIRTLTTRDNEVRRDLQFLENRLKKKALAAAARGPFDITGEGVSQIGMTETEKQALERLKKEDYFTPAIEVYQALGPSADNLKSGVVGSLILAAAARGRADVALSLFDRIESMPDPRVPVVAYEGLIDLHAREKDAAGIMRVFEGYLKARQNGLQVPSKRASRTRYRKVATKHRHSAVPDYVLETDGADAADYFGMGDAAVWRRAITALFEAGDSAQAVTLFHRLIEAVDSPETSPLGYPAPIPASIVATVVSQFARTGEFDTAREWFERGQTLSAGETENSATEPAVQHEAYFTEPLYAVVDNFTVPAMDFAAHVFLTKADRCGPTIRLAVSDFVVIVDHCLAVSYKASSDADRRHALDIILKAEAAFTRAVQQGHVAQMTSDYTHSTGIYTRIISAMGHARRFEDSAKLYSPFAEVVERALRSALSSSNDGPRSASRWATVASSTPLRAGLGMSAQWSDLDKVVLWSFASDTRPPVRAAASMVGACNRIRSLLRWGWEHDMAALVVECFLRDKAAVQGDLAALGLGGDEWFTVISAFAHVSAQLRLGFVPTFEFPGFEPIIDDFAASKVQIPAGKHYDYAQLVNDLRKGGMSEERSQAVLAVLSDVLAESVAKSSGSPPGSAQAVDSFAAAEASFSESMPLEESTSASEPETSATFPTPPSTPPSYVLDTAPNILPIKPSKIDLHLSSTLDSLVFKLKSEQATELVRKNVRDGRFAHPEALGRLVELLGREGKVDAVKEMYLLAFSALHALAKDAASHSVAWVTLEDHMIVALAQAGLLDEIGHHRDRLLQAGTAPSADAYAAMILNMKETTDDAAVALMLFEESQRFNVMPNVYLFNTLISKLSRARRAKEALEYFELMKTFGLQPSSVTYGAVINACCKTGDDASAEYLFNEMVSSPTFRPRVPPYNMMIQFYVSTKPNRERALYYYNQLVAARVQPTAHTYKLLLDAYGSIGEPDLTSLENVFRTLCQDRSVTVAGVHWASIINAYGVVVKDLDKAIGIFDSIEQHPTTVKSGSKLPDAVVYESLLNALLANDRADLCERYVQDMDRRGVRKTAYVANCLIKAYAAQGDMQSARNAFGSMADPPTGVAAAGNHPVDRHPKHQHHVSTSLPASSPVFREPSTWETMIKAELGASEGKRAIELMQRVEQRGFPEAVVRRLRGLLTQEGYEPVSM